MKRNAAKGAKKPMPQAPQTPHETQEFLRLNVGAGDTSIEGFIPVDRCFGSEAYPLSYADNSVDEIRASHILEHFHYSIAEAVVTDWVRALKPGGIIRIAVPDLEYVAREYLDGKPINAQALIHGSQNYKDNLHLCSFDEEVLREVMINAGITRIQRWKSEINDCAAQPWSLNLMGYKPTTTDQVVTGVFAVGADARFGPTLHHKCVDDALAKARIPVDKLIGCYWHQNMSQKIEQHMSDPGVEFILTLDYDTVFRAEDVVELYRLMKARPDVDAVIPVQMKRTNDCALFNMLDAQGNPKRTAYLHEFQKNLIRVSTGHFGLTMFRASRLRKLPKPWMCPKPAPDGTWGDGHIDADIDFWLNWRKAGFTAYLAPKVVVGHMEELIVWPGESLKPVYQDISTFFEVGKPAEARIC